jgi:hypothetical protein
MQCHSRTRICHFLQCQCITEVRTFLTLILIPSFSRSIINKEHISNIMQQSSLRGKIGCSIRSITPGSAKLRLEILYLRVKRISLCTLTMRLAGHRNWAWTTSLTSHNLKMTSTWIHDTTRWCLLCSFERKPSWLQAIHPSISWPHIDILSVNMNQSTTKGRNFTSAVISRQPKHKSFIDKRVQVITLKG